jgi:hypothetical protein
MNLSAAFRTSSVETPLGLVSNRLGMTFPSVVILRSGSASLLAHNPRTFGESALPHPPESDSGSGRRPKGQERQRK